MYYKQLDVDYVIKLFHDSGYQDLEIEAVIRAKASGGTTALSLYKRTQTVWRTATIYLDAMVKSNDRWWLRSDDPVWLAYQQTRHASPLEPLLLDSNLFRHGLRLLLGLDDNRAVDELLHNFNLEIAHRNMRPTSADRVTERGIKNLAVSIDKAYKAYTKKHGEPVVRKVSS